MCPAYNILVIQALEYIHFPPNTVFVSLDLFLGDDFERNLNGHATVREPVFTGSPAETRERKATGRVRTFRATRMGKRARC